MVVTDDPVDPRAYEAVSREPVTAIAIRYQPGLRIAGQDHAILPLITKSEPKRQPSTAVRLNIGGRFVWVVSNALADACAQPTSPCPELTALQSWRDAKLSAGEAVISGGLNAVLAPEALPACGQQALTITPARKDAAPKTTFGASDGDLGCVVRATAGGEPDTAKPTP
jgi:hypothetical protein